MTFCAPRPLADDDSIEGFTCGAPLVDSWFAARARGARRGGTAVVYVSLCDDGTVAGFYALSSQSISRAAVGGGWLARNAPEQIPVILLGMLGVDRRYAGRGLGRDLLLDAVHRSQGVAQIVGARALVVDPLGEEARSFYAHYGFREIPGSDRMFAKLG